MYSIAERTWLSRQDWWPYVEIARADHWIKNAFMLLGALLAIFYQPSLLRWESAAKLGLAVLATCLVASSNYVLNELLDGPTDRFHPLKQHRPVPSGRIRTGVAVAEWLLLGAVGIGLACGINRYFVASAVWLWVMGVAYNVPPVRTKELPYLDVLSESVNNAIRLLLGWFSLVDDRVPPVSLILAYWMAGAFFMATKRFAEYRSIADPTRAAVYRRSFAYYNGDRLLVSMLFYATACALFSGIFIVRYHLELILFVPPAAGFFAYYLRLGLKPDSPAQHPERLHREHGFLVYATVSVLLFVALMFTSIPHLYDWFNVEASKTMPLWTLGPKREEQAKHLTGGSPAGGNVEAR
jgi:decaprenyl-phosphate phosphoribosyltransferase